VSVSPANSGNVKLVYNGNTYTSAPTYPVTYEGITLGSTVNLEALPASGYYFSSWSGALTGTANPTTMVADCNKAITVYFTASPPVTTTTLTVSVSPAGSGAVKVNGTTYSPPYPRTVTGITTGSTVNLEALPASGYSFSSWSGDVTGAANPTTLVANSAKTFAANFTTSPTPPPPGQGYKLYFPHVQSQSGSAPLWETEVCVINTGNQAITGTLKSYKDDGQAASANKTITLAARGRWSRIVGGGEFTNPSQIGYMVFESNSAGVAGYVKFYREGMYRAAVPAVKEVTTARTIYIPHIASDAQWWTGMSLVNTTGTAKNLTIVFNTSQRQTITLAAGQHRLLMISDLFGGLPQPDIKSAIINNAAGIVGLLLFGTSDGDNLLEGLLLTDKTASTLFYPHVVNYNEGWWTGIVAYNTSPLSSVLTITPYNAQGTPLSPATLSIAARERYVGLFTDLGLPAETAWFRIDSTRPLNGFELFATYDGNLLAAYADVGGTGTLAGVFPKIEKNGWTGIAFVNTEATAATVTLTAYNDNGAALATRVLSVGAHAKEVHIAEEMFVQSISTATYIAYSANRKVVGFQLNGSLDGMMLDGLPGLAGTN
jgi:hypothetical protein